MVTPLGYRVNTPHSLRASDGLNLNYYAAPNEAASFTLLTIHGLGEHAGRYEWLAEQVIEAGGEMFALDLRGHGLSKGKRGHTPSYPQLLDDLQRFITHVQTPSRPLFLFGHSLGGGLAIQYALRNPTLTGLIASAPLLRLAFEPPAWKLALARMLVKVLPSFSLDRGIEHWKLTRNEEIREAYERDTLAHDRVSAAMTVGFLDAARWNLDHAHELTTPALLMHGKADQVTSWEATAEFAANTPQPAEIITYPPCYHELINEPERVQIVADMLRWIKRHTA